MLDIEELEDVGVPEDADVGGDVEVLARSGEFKEVDGSEGFELPGAVVVAAATVVDNVDEIEVDAAPGGVS